MAPETGEAQDDLHAWLDRMRDEHRPMERSTEDQIAEFKTELMNPTTTYGPEQNSSREPSTGESRFSSKVRCEIEHDRVEEQRLATQRSRVAQAAAQTAMTKLNQETQLNAEIAARISHKYALLELQATRANMHEGTPPEDVWGSGGGKVCKEFIDFIKDRQFEGASVLTHVRFFGQWSIRGYGVGGIYRDPPGFRAHKLRIASKDKDIYGGVDLYKGTTLPHNIFLCVDGKLRLYTNNQFIDDIRRSELHIISHKDPSKVSNSQPDTLSDLPLDFNGKATIPAIGYFARTIRHSGSTYHKSHESAGDTDGQGGAWVEEASSSYRGSLIKQSLEDILMGYAKTAEILRRN